MQRTVAFAYCIGLRPPWIKAYVLRELTYTHGYRAAGRQITQNMFGQGLADVRARSQLG